MALALDTVRGLLAAKITGLGYVAKEFRDEDDAITEAEVPCVLVQQAGVVSVDYLEGTVGGVAVHTAPFLLSFAAATRDAAASMLTATVNALADDYNFAGQVLEIIPVSYGEEEPDGRDIRAIMLEIGIRYCTAPNDFGTLLT